MLHDILAYISFEQIPHRVQQVMSNESTPILSHAIPVFELFMTHWEQMMQQQPHLEKYIKPGLECAYQYYNCMDHTSAYIVAMRMYISILGIMC
jgi:hypothetical protein